MLTDFYPPDAMLARYLLSSRAVRPSQASIVSKWLNAGSQKQRHTRAQGLYSFMMQKTSTKFQWDHSQRGRQMQVG